MEQKTKIHAQEGKHDLTITREFDLPVELLFKAHQDKELFEEWMTHDYGIVKALTYEVKKHGSFHFQNSDLSGNVVFSASGTFHDVIPNEKIIRTFEMSNSPFDVQLDFLHFEKLGNDKSKLTIHQVFRSGAIRDELLKLPFAQGLNMAHNRLENVVSKLK
jgi:uncharacterized protein YndB with AHSA1/START domain